jgi:hypothetical protein
MKSNAAEFIQYLSPHLSLGPSSNTCHKCESHDFTSVLFIKNELSFFSDMKFSSIGFVKAGQPVPESNLSVEEKSAVLSTIST